MGWAIVWRRAWESWRWKTNPWESRERSETGESWEKKKKKMEE